MKSTSRTPVILAVLSLMSCILQEPEGEGDLATVVEGKALPLSVATSHGKDLVWSKSQRKDIRYCVEPGMAGRYGGFGADANRVREAAINAGSAWGAAADIDFNYVEITGCNYCDPRVTVADTNCAASTQMDVDFAIIPYTEVKVTSEITPDGEMITRRTWVPIAGSDGKARATFVPGLLIGKDDFQAVRIGTGVVADPACLKQTLVHEFGHTLGFLHEHQRQDAPGDQYEGVFGECPAKSLKVPVSGFAPLPCTIVSR